MKVDIAKITQGVVLAGCLVAAQISHSQGLSVISLFGIDALKEVKGVLGPKGASYEPGTKSGRFNANTIFLAEQLDANADAGVRSRITAVSSIQSLSDLNETTPLGLLISEHIAHHLKIRGWALAEPRLANSLSFRDDGEFGLSRNPERVTPQVSAQNLVTGTYFPTRDGILVSLRIIDVVTGRLVSTAQTRIPRDSFSREALGVPTTDTPLIRISN
jgi:hypothetical protein